MKIAAYAIGNIERASSRLRSFYLFSLADQFGLQVSRPSRYRDGFGADVVHIQKILSVKVFFAIIAYRLLGIKVIYDVDDQHNRNNPILGVIIFLGYLVALFFSSVGTVDTEGRRAYWKKYLAFKKIVVINDIADTDQVDLKIKDRSAISDANSFFWTGYSVNLMSLTPFLNYLKNTKKYNLIVSIEEKAIPSLRDRYPFVRFIPWFDGVAYDSDVKAKFMILNHDADSSALLKSENKMVLAILAGFVPIVSRTPSYEKLAKLLNADFLLFDRLNDVPKIIESLGSINFVGFFERSIEVINTHYSRRAVLLEFVNSALELQ